MENKFNLKTLKFLIILLLFYIVGTDNLFLYVLSLSLYKIFTSCFSHVKVIDKIKDKNDSQKIYQKTLLVMSVLSLFFIILGITISDISSNLLNLENSFLVFLMMGLSIITEPYISITKEYIEVTKSKKVSKSLYNLYHTLECILTILFAFIFFQIFEVKNHIAVSMLYLPKIISAISVATITYLITKDKKKKISLNNLNLKNTIKEIFLTEHGKSIVKIVKNSYYYVGLIITYIVLSTRYGYSLEKIESILVYIYFYFINLIEYIIFIVTTIIKNKDKKLSIISSIHKTLEIMLTITIIIGMISPLICKILFNVHNISIYLMMTSLMGLFIALYNLTNENIKNNQVICISVSSGLIAKLILIIPLINSFYRMGYNLIYGDIISTIIGLLITIIINYIYIKNKQRKKENNFETILKILYENILLCIILTICQFVIPIKTDNYFKAILLITIYILISIIYLKLKDKKRG